MRNRDTEPKKGRRIAEEAIARHRAAEQAKRATTAPRIDWPSLKFKDPTEPYRKLKLLLERPLP
jgi:hypothetical protein